MEKRAKKVLGLIAVVIVALLVAGALVEPRGGSAAVQQITTSRRCEFLTLQGTTYAICDDGTEWVVAPLSREVADGG